jgi:mono/diheme cytochrome c family protein
VNRISGLIVVGFIMGGFVEYAQAQQRGAPAAAEVAETGAETYAAHCASCHGGEGKGDGPTAPALRQKPADLTTIARRRGGTFPRTEMADFILGRGKRIGAHGTRDMPVWGPLFKDLNPFDSRVDVRVERLLDYIQSLQVK